jgi:putative colanic acid biosynthesis glycosyltransferase WcaI
MRIQLWSYNYDPEPTGIGQVSRVWAQAMRERGHEVRVIAAHPHYPEPRWGTRLIPYRETREGVLVLRLPLWIGRGSAGERYRQELSFMLAQSMALPMLGRPDVVVSVSPCFPALAPGIAFSRMRRIPWMIWLQDVLPDGAATTGLIDDGLTLRMARRLELAAYRAAAKIAVPSRTFAKNLTAKGVPEAKLDVIYNPATQPPATRPQRSGHSDELRVLSMGNIGYSQGLAQLVRAFESADQGGVKLVITGAGVAEGDVREEIRSARVEMLGLVDDVRLRHELGAADVALVSQRHDVAEFNIPSKIMNFMAHGLPIVAVVSPGSEAARIVRESGGGWVVNSAQPDGFPRKLHEIAAGRQEIARRGEAAYEYAQGHFTPASIAERFDKTLSELVAHTAETSTTRRARSLRFGTR